MSFLFELDRNFLSVRSEMRTLETRSRLLYHRQTRACLGEESRGKIRRKCIRRHISHQKSFSKASNLYY